MKRIFIITENYFKGGLDTFIINLINCWPDKTSLFSISCNSNHPGLSEIYSTTKNVKIIPYKILINSNIFNDFIILKIFYKIIHYFFLAPFYILFFILYFFVNKYDLLLSINGGYPASLICRCALIGWKISNPNKRSVLNFHNSTKESNNHLNYFDYLIDILVKKSCKQFVTVSKDCLETFLSRRAFNNISNATFIHNGIIDPLVNISDKQLIRTINADYCLMLATYEERKGHRFLFDAFSIVIKHFPLLELHIFGYGNNQYRKLLEDYLFENNLNNNIFLHDFISDTSEIIYNAEIMLVPSQSHESFGLTIIEGMAFSKPIVATNVGGIPEVLIKSGGGYVCDKDNHIKFSQKIIDILSNRSLKIEIGDKGRQYYLNNYTAQEMSLQYFKFINNLN